MTDYAIIRYGVIERLVNLDDISNWAVGEDAAYPDRAYLLPLDITDPAYDPIIEVKEGPVDTVLADRVTHVFTVRAKDAGEIAAMKADKIARIHALGDSKLEALVLSAAQIQALASLLRIIYDNTDKSGWSSPDQDEATLHMTSITDIEDLRDFEETKVGEVNALADDPAVIDAYDVEAGW